MELHEAIRQISAIRQQMARTEQFRGYRAAPAACSGLLAFAAGAYQSLALPNPQTALDPYLILWLSIAVVGFVLSMIDIVIRYTRSTGQLNRETTRLALGQFLPSLATGGLVTIALANASPESAWLLPGLWSLFFSLGLFASRTWLPRPITAVAAYYLLGGLFIIAQGNPDLTFSPWTMPLLFGVGQLASALILFRDEQTQDTNR